MLEKLSAIADKFLFEYVKTHGGSITGEHGVGQQRAAQIAAVKDPGLYSAIKIVKQAFDPKGILNPYKVIDPPL